MQVRRAHQGDIPRALDLARRLGLDYPGLEADPLWVAEEAGEVVGLVALKTHPDCLELCALGVAPRLRGKGIARALVEALVSEAPGDVHLATIIPSFFEMSGFETTADVPATFPATHQTAWCEGCPHELCTVMSRKKR